MKSLGKNQSGFTVVEIVICVVVLALIVSFVGWRVYDANQTNKQTTLSGPLTTEDQAKLEVAKSGELKESTKKSETKSTANTSTSTSEATSTSASNPPTSKPKTESTTATSNITRPTTAFCQQKNGNSFKDLWATENKTHTYKVYENGVQVSKTAKGTAARNSDTMQVVGVIPYLTQAEYAICSQKSGYIMFYYKPDSSVYTYNWLVKFDQVSVTKP